ncbi:NAD(P)-binding protein [Ramicandelaber brevisporus]|nr:NAD(P)-binding protein [Ramicandelaber brevisporus]
MSATIPATQRAIPLTKTGDISVLKVESIPAPRVEDLPEGGIIVQNKSVGVNFLDALQRKGAFPYEIGKVLGTEAAGVVAASRNPNFKVGDRVVHGTYVGTYSEYTQIDSTHAVGKLPDDIDFDTAAATFIAGLTSLGMFRFSHGTKPEHTIVITAAAGGVGQALVQVGKNVIGARVIGVTSSEDKAKVVKAAGADEVVIVPRGKFTGDINEHPLVKGVMGLTNGKGADAVFESVGADLFDAALASLAIYGHMVNFGNSSGMVPPFEITRLSAKNVNLHWHSMFADYADADRTNAIVKELFPAVSQGKFTQTIFKTYPLEEAAQAHADIESGASHGKLILHI